MNQKPLFIQIGGKYFALSYILYVDDQRESMGRIDIDYGREETLSLHDEEAEQFMKLFNQHCQVVTGDGQC